jgi:hypothetical protein
MTFCLLSPAAAGLPLIYASFFGFHAARLFSLRFRRAIAARQPPFSLADLKIPLIYFRHYDAAILLWFSTWLIISERRSRWLMFSFAVLMPPLRLPPLPCFAQRLMLPYARRVMRSARVYTRALLRRAMPMLLRHAEAFSYVFSLIFS